MKKIRRLVLIPTLTASLLVSFLLISKESSAQESQLKDVIKRVMPATVLVVTYDASGQLLSQGSGFFVSEKGEVITNYHVISGAISAVVKLPDGSVYKITDVLAEDINSDLIKLKVDTSGSKVQYLPLYKALVEVGEKIVVIGSPQGLESTVSDGIVSAVRDVQGFGNIIQITAPISPGSSGSAVVNMKGEVVGVASAQILEGQNLNFVVPAGKITELKEQKQAIARKEDSAKIQSDDIYSKAMFYYLKADYEKALPFFKQYLQTHPDSSSDAWFYAGACYGELGLHQEALQAYKQAIRLKPDDAEAHCGLGWAYGELGLHQEALQAHKQAIRLKPDFAEAHYNLGAAYGNLGLYQEAIQAYKEAIRLKPDFAEAHLNLGSTYGKLGLYQEALQACKQAIKLEPDDAMAHSNLGNAYLNLGLHQEALRAHKQAIRLKPDFAEAHYNLGNAYLNLGLYQEAIQAYKQAIRLKPDYVKAHSNLGNAYLNLGLHQEALQTYKQAIKLKPDYANTHYNLGVAYGNLGRWQEALQAYKQAIKLKPDYADAHYNLGVTYSNLGLWQEALQAYKQAIRLKPDYAGAHLNLGVIYLNKSDTSSALEEYKILKNLDAEMANKLFNIIYK